ncbi:FlgO family outer membrane protein [Paraglaciecola mesophila]|nr:FlgO family outer membrane protein [Paraglaciecola mesophila]
MKTFIVDNSKMVDVLTKACCAGLLLISVSGCSMFQGEDEIIVDKSDPQYLELKAMLEQQKIEWEAQKPALERLVKNEEDLAFLIDALSKMAVIGSSPSLEQYMLGQPQYAQDSEKEPQNKGIAVGGSHTINAGDTNTSINVNNVNSGNTSYANPLAPLADSPEELTQLMNDLQKIARTQRYKALNKSESVLIEDNPENGSVTQPMNERQLGNANGRYMSNHGGIFSNSKVGLGDYAQQLAGKLAKFSALEGTTVGVASFVDFDETLRNSSSLGNQFAEALATELPRYGVNVVDFKLTKHIDVSAMGDLALSRNGAKLNGQTNMSYVLTGTLIATHRGVKINSRVVSVDDNSVIAAASTFVPRGLLQQIQP